MMKRLLYLLLIVFLPGISWAQKASVRSEKYKIRIGEQIELLLKAEPVGNQKVVWPQLSDSLGPHFDIVKTDTLDTIPGQGNNPPALEQRIYITSFDSGMHSLPVFDFLFITPGADTVSVLSDVLSIEVLTVPVDTTKAIKDIYGLEDVPADFTDLIIYSLLGALALAIVAFIIYKIRQQKKPAVVEVPKGPVIPAWEIALSRLTEIEQEAAWKSGNDKAYHSAISETLRAYIEAHLKLPALESTSDETLEMLRKSGVTEDAQRVVKQVFVLADLVKFAKEKPLPAEHQRSLELAREFVALTRPAAAPEPEKEVKDA